MILTAKAKQKKMFKNMFLNLRREDFKQVTYLKGNQKDILLTEIHAEHILWGSSPCTF